MHPRLHAKRVAIYARYSSALQRETSIEDQVRRCREYLERDGGCFDPALVFCDSATSGASLARPGLEQLLKLADDRKIDVIVTEDVSRISRDIADSAAIFKRLQYLGIVLRGVADGIDTGERSAKLTFTIKSLVSEVYLDDLRDKTLRGLEGRALAGYSTGSLPIGYRSSPEVDAYNRIIGHRIEIDPQGRSVVERIFTLYRDGLSLGAIAALFNEESVPPPRAHTRHRRKGWVATTIRDILRNEAYVGRWSFKKTQWVKLPGTNIRRYRKRPEHEIIRQQRPELAIIDAELWHAVRARANAVAATYTQGPRGVPKGRASGRKNDYVLSGVLRCGECGAAMTISRGTSAHYYRCGDHKKRGNCMNRRSLREDTARQRLFDAVMERYRTPEAITFLRQRLVDALTKISRDGNAQLEERRARLARTEERIAGLVEFIARGDQSEYVRKTLIDLEAQAKQEKTAIAELVRTAGKPIQLPTPELILQQCARLEAIAQTEPLRAREALRALFGDEGLLVKPDTEGRYRAEGRFYPLALFTLDLSERNDKTSKTPAFDQGLRSLLDSCSSEGCAGRN